LSKFFKQKRLKALNPNTLCIFRLSTPLSSRLIGLQKAKLFPEAKPKVSNLDNESEQFRPFKQIIKRLNRTYKYHVKPSHGFNCCNGALALITLFVTHHNFLRPYMSLNYKTPVQLQELEGIYREYNKNCGY